MYLKIHKACARFYTIFIAVSIHTTSISIGMAQGFSAVLIPQLESNDSSIWIDPEDASWIASLGVISTPGGALLSGFLSETLGRKLTIQLTSVPFFLGWLCMAISSQKTWLYIGRFVTGFAIGMGSTSYVYLAEIGSPSERGMLAALGPVFVSLGVLLVYLFGYLLDWHMSSIVCASTALLSFFLIRFLPETPPWLASKGHLEKATQTLLKLRANKEEADKEIKQLMQSDDCNNSLSFTQYFQKITDATVYKPFLILIIFFLCQEGSGMYIIVYYATNVFGDLGAVIDSSLESIIVGLVRLVTSTFGSVCIQNFGRKPMAIVSSSLMGLSMGVAAYYNYRYGNLEMFERPLPSVPFICLVINVFASMLGMLQLPWLMIGEMFPLSVRGFMSGVVSSLGYLFIFAIIKIYPNLMSTLNLTGMMGLFAATSITTVLFVIFFLPETRGKQLIDIENSFRKTNDKKDIESVDTRQDVENIDPIYTLRL